MQQLEPMHETGLAITPPTNCSAKSQPVHGVPVSGAPSERCDETLYTSCWTNAASGIILAGGLYPLVIAAALVLFAGLVLSWHLLVDTSGAIQVGDLIGVLIATLFSGCGAAVIGFVWSSLVLLVTLPLVYLFSKSLNLNGSRVALGALWGGFVGFAAVLPFVIGLWYDDFGWPNASIGWALVLATGPGLATLMGQLGGAWGASRPSEEEMIARARLEEAQAPGSVTANAADVAACPAGEPPLRFTLRQMLWIAVWISLMLTAIRLIELPFELMLPLIGGWLVFQALTYRIGRVLARQLGPWWHRQRASRST